MMQRQKWIASKLHATVGSVVLPEELEQLSKSPDVSIFISSDGDAMSLENQVSSSLLSSSE